MTPSTNGALVAEIRLALANAEAAGDPAPGRPTLARMTGASEHAVRRVLAELAKSGWRAGAVAGEAGGTNSPAAHQNAPAGGRLVAWVGFVFGSLTSVAANVLAARIAPQHAAAGWHPSVYAEVGAAVWPVALLLSVEGLSRVRWPNSALWNLARYGGAGTVALGSALISYSHIAAVLAFWGYSTLAACVGPLVVDGLMTVSGFALLATAGGLVTPAVASATSASVAGGERR
jgi:hypothetical protein